MPNFREYDRGHSHESRDAAAVTIQRRELITFNQAAARALGNPTAVTFLIDEDERLLGFRAAGGGAGRPATAVVRGPGAMISAVTVLRHLNADLSEPRRYPLVVMGDVHCIDLKRPGTIVTNNRRKPSA